MEHPLVPTWMEVLRFFRMQEPLEDLANAIHARCGQHPFNETVSALINGSDDLINLASIDI